MEIIVNGESEEVETGKKLAKFLASKDLKLSEIVVEYNQEIIKEDKWKNTILAEGDKLEILKFVGGG
ncbi:MAG: sulfur carrier protein ThiS [Halanaerobacter sp.]